MMSKNKWIVMMFVVLMSAGGFGYKMYSDNYYKTHFRNGTELYSTDLSKMTVDEALSTPIKGATLIIVNNDEEIEVPFGDLLNIDKNTMDKYLKTRSFDVHLDENTFAERIRELKLNKANTDTEDAKIIKENGVFSIKEEVHGTKFNEEKLIDSAIQLIKENKFLKIETNEYSTPPTVTKNEKKLLDKLNQLELMETASIVIKINDEEIPLDKSIVKNSVRPEEVDTKEIRSVLESLNDRYKTLNTNINFRTHNGKELTMWNSSTIGWEIDIDKTLSTVKDEIENYSGKERAAVVSVNTLGEKHENVFGGNYAEVDLNEQKAYIFKDGKQVFSWDVITGLPNQQNMTNVGIHQVMYKESPSVLRGYNNDGSRYASPVNYWIPFNAEGEGFHDANWQVYGFGGDRYKTLGSHGCVNTSPSDMNKVWELTYSGMPVIVWGDIYNGI